MAAPAPAPAVARWPRPVIAYFLVINLKKSRHSSSYSSHCMSVGQQRNTEHRETKRNRKQTGKSVVAVRFGLGCCMVCQVRQQQLAHVCAPPTAPARATTITTPTCVRALASCPQLLLLLLPRQLALKLLVQLTGRQTAQRQPGANLAAKVGRFTTATAARAVVVCAVVGSCVGRGRAAAAGVVVWEREVCDEVCEAAHRLGLSTTQASTRCCLVVGAALQCGGVKAQLLQRWQLSRRHPVWVLVVLVVSGQSSSTTRRQVVPANRQVLVLSTDATTHTQQSASLPPNNATMSSTTLPTQHLRRSPPLTMLQAGP